MNIPNLNIYVHHCGCGSGLEPTICGCNPLPQTVIPAQTLPAPTTPCNNETECEDPVTTYCVKADFNYPSLGIAIGDPLTKIINLFLQVIAAGGVGATPSDALTSNDIQNDLLSITPGKVLDAVQGAILNRYIRGAAVLPMLEVIPVNAAIANFFTLNLTDDATLSKPTGAYHGQRITIAITQTSAGGNLITWPPDAYYFSNDKPIPILSSIPGQTDYIEFIYNNILGKFHCINWSIGAN